MLDQLINMAYDLLCQGLDYDSVYDELELYMLSSFSHGTQLITQEDIEEAIHIAISMTN